MISTHKTQEFVYLTSNYKRKMVSYKTMSRRVSVVVSSLEKTFEHCKQNTA